MDKDQRKMMEFWKGRQKQNKERQQKRKKWSILKTGLLGEDNRKKPLKLQRVPFLGLFYKTKAQQHKQQKDNTTKKQITRPKNTFLHFGNNPKFFGHFCFFQVTLFHVCKAVLCWKHCKSGVFSRARLLCITDSKTPFWGENPKWHFWHQKCHFGFSPVPAETPIFVVFGDFVWSQKEGDMFPKQIVSTKMRFSLPSERK